jgi:hypothetical protein
MIVSRLEVGVAEFESNTGWTLKPEGACKGETCIPIPDGAVSAGTVHVAPTARALGMPVVHDERRSLYAIGPESLSGHALVSAEAPELALPTIDGNEFRLSSLRGQKVVIVAWAPY